MPFMMRSLIPPGHPTTGVGPFNRRLECHYRDGLLGAVRSPPLSSTARICRRVLRLWPPGCSTRNLICLSPKPVGVVAQLKRASGPVSDGFRLFPSHLHHRVEGGLARGEVKGVHRFVGDRGRPGRKAVQPGPAIAHPHRPGRDPIGDVRARPGRCGCAMAGPG